MNLKYFLGASYFRTIEAVVSSPAFPLTRYFPRGIFWMFDIQRFLGTRSLGVLFDVGANTGQTLKTLLHHAPKAKIYSFEPTLETFRILALPGIEWVILGDHRAGSMQVRTLRRRYSSLRNP